MKSWFESKDCNALEIKNVKTDQALHLSDAGAIKKIMQQIESISPHGQMMAKLLIESEIDLNFTCGFSSTRIRILNDRFQTPTTGFNTEDKDIKIESELNSDIRALLAPALNQRILKVKDLELFLGDFSITYKGLEERKQKPGEPTVGTISRQHFSIKDQSGKTQELQASSGQTPPPPLEFSANGSKLKLLTYTDKNGGRLYPDYFVIGE